MSQDKQTPDDVETFLAEAEARANKASPGPWTYCYPFIVIESASLGKIGEFVLIKDAQFVASARTDVTRLVAIAREQQAQLRLAYEAVLQAADVAAKNKLYRVRNQMLRDDNAALHERVKSLTAAEEIAAHVATELRDRLAKLEAKLAHVEEFGSLPSDENATPEEARVAWQEWARSVGARS